MEGLYKGSNMLKNLFFNIENHLIFENNDIGVIDDYIGKFYKQNGLISAPKIEYNFPTFSCISVNDIVTHGIAKNYKMKRGDVISIDISFLYPDNHYFDSARTFIVDERIEDIASRMMIEFNKKIIYIAIDELNSRLACNKIIFYEDFGKIFYELLKRTNYATVDAYGGHKIGRNKLHLEPFIPNLFDPRMSGINKIEEDDVFCVEPLICPRRNEELSTKVVQIGKWEVKTVKQVISSHYEVMIIRKLNRLICLT